MISARDTEKKKRRWPRGLLLGALAAITAMSACSGKRYYHATERALETDSFYHTLDHILTYYPSGVALNFPGYIVGLEISPFNSVTGDEGQVIFDPLVIGDSYSLQRLVGTMNFDLPYVSQVIRYRGRPYGEGNCALHNLYHNSGSTIIEPCREITAGETGQDSDYSDAFIRSWEAIDVLKSRLAADVESQAYTHLVVAVMGLDTPQEEALRNFKSIIASIRRSAGESFKPLFIGITWPSFFANRWFDPMWETFAYSTIADRADILGLSWLGVLMQEAVLPLSERIETVIIGHSFGARAASMALCIGPAIQRRTDPPGRDAHSGRIDRFIGMAPAFSLKRFIRYRNLFYEDVHYPDYCPATRQFVFTASDKDNAFDPVFWSDTAGDYDNMTKFCGDQQPVPVACVNADDSGNFDSYDTRAKIVYLDTTTLMKYTVPEGKGTGHADIFRPQIGNMLWQLIDGGDR